MSPLAADHLLFHCLNGVLTHPWLDAVMPVLTDLHKVAAIRWVAAPGLVAAWLYVGRARALKTLLAAGLAVGLTDAVAARILKPALHRPRPAAPEAVVRAPASGFGMPSNHAANLAAAARVLGAAEPALLAPAWGVTLLIAYSRVYVGAHYPADVLVGLLLGVSIGSAAVYVLRKPSG